MKQQDICRVHGLKEDVITVMQNTISAVKRGDVYAIAEESNHIIHCATVFQKPEAAQTAVVIYALGKMVERGKTIATEILDAMEKAIDFMKYDNLKGFNNQIKVILKMIGTIDDHLSKYMQHVITEARIKKGSRIYEHGISLRQTAEIFGLSQWELMRYIGKTKMSEYAAETIPIKKRLAFARALFK